MTFDAPKVIVALDYDNATDALQFVHQLSPELCRLKVGKELFVSAGPALVEQLVEQGYSVFLDLKFHDIPNTVAKACRAAANLGVWMTNVHALGGVEMMAAAAAAIAGLPHRPLLLGVTVLTSTQQEDLPKIGINNSLLEEVQLLTDLTYTAGLDGVVCSAHEAKELKARFRKGFCLVTPGIRLADNVHHDQKRVMTPEQALRAGSNYIVMGRAITGAPNPCEILEQINSITI
ncbi:MAG: orotidine-5'-phosphate decarboxylase [Gammaproteobacteria bacterium]|nr:orotidine-5'-phosphate decarboxylase [Gammaproteobacteria bacterium]